MQVHQILKSKGDDGVVTVEPEITVGEASKVLSSRRIGTVVISRDGKIALGILSERDIVREIGRAGGRILNERVSVMMTSNPVTCSADDAAEDILRIMTEKRFRHMPVVRDGEMIGIITIGDVVKARLTELSMEKSALEGMIMGF